jgi:hypothetical protein
MANVLLSEVSCDYGYEDSGEQVKIVLRITRGVTPISIETALVEGDSYTPQQIWQGVIYSWNAYAWSGSAPSLTIDYLTLPNTEFSSNDGTINFQSISVFCNINNPRSLELPMILGLANKMQTTTVEYKVDWDISPYNDAPGYLPYMGTWRLQCNIDTGYGFTSNVSTWSPLESRTDASTDINRTSLSNGADIVVRGYQIKISMVPYKYVKQYDAFRDFARRGQLTLAFGFDLFTDGTTSAYLWNSESGSVELVFDAEQLCSYTIGLLPISNLEV